MRLSEFKLNLSDISNLTLALRRWIDRSGDRSLATLVLRREIVRISFMLLSRACSAGYNISLNDISVSRLYTFIFVPVLR